MIAGTKEIFMRIILFVQNFIKQCRAFFKAVTVLIPAVKIDFQALEAFRMFGKRKRAVLFPVGLVERRSKGVPENAGVKSPAAVGWDRVRKPGSRTALWVPTEPKTSAWRIARCSAP